MNNNIYFNIYRRKSTHELLSDLRKGIANNQSMDGNALYAIKVLLASRHLSDSELATFESLTKGEVFEKIDNAEVHEQASEPDVVLDSSQPSEFNWVRHILGGISYMALQRFYFEGHFPSSWYGVGSYILGVLVYETIVFLGAKMKL